MESNLKEIMLENLTKEISEGAENEILAFQAATEKLQEINNLRRQYVGQAEDLRKKVNEKATPAELDLTKIKDKLKSKIETQIEIQAIEDTIGEIDEVYLPAATAELEKRRKELYAFTNPAIIRHREVWQTKIFLLCDEINAIIDNWSATVNVISRNPENKAISASMFETMTDLLLDVPANRVGDPLRIQQRKMAAAAKK